MTVTVLGNHSKGYLSESAGGNGIQNVPAGMGWVAVTGSAAGDKAVVQLTTILTGEINQGVFFQSETGASVDFTLFNPGAATSPDPLVAAAVAWGSVLALPAGQIVKAPVLFTCLRLTFTAPGTVYIGVR